MGKVLIRTAGIVRGSFSLWELPNIKNTQSLLQGIVLVAKGQVGQWGNGRGG